MEILPFRDPAFAQKVQAFLAGAAATPEIRATVAQVLADVAAEGDAALLRYTAQFDGHTFTAQDLRVPASELAAAAAELPAAQTAAIQEALTSVEAFHRQSLPRDWQSENLHGATVGEKWYPLQRVGIYIPAGQTPLVSTAVMTITLARIAGVPEIAVFTPPGPTGALTPQMAAGLHLCGATEVYRVGGAQAIAAAAFGTATIPPVRKIMGPGNAFVAEAQRQVFGTVGIDLLPGPSEACLIADASADPAWIAADLLAQAEHSTGREKVTFIYLDPAQAEAVQAKIEAQLPTLSHADAIRRVLDTHTLFIPVSSLEEAIAAANLLAPEHLELHVAEDALDALITGITTAGAILCGHETPTVLGDFVAGPSHTLPTGGTGRFFSGLKITDFMRRSSLVRYDRAGLHQAAPTVAAFAAMEGLDAHGQSLQVRLSH